MEVPRLLAIDHVHMSAPVGRRQAIEQFYLEVLGFDAVVTGEADDARLAFRGYPRSGPRLLIDLTEHGPTDSLRPRAIIQIASLQQCADELAERGIWFEWSRGWFFHARRLSTLDPGGNLIELVASHPA